MSDPVDELARKWLARAGHDLRSAEHLLTMSAPPVENVGFHAQQCAEKSLKGFLVFHGMAFERRHDLNYLIDLCVLVNPDFERLRAGADELTPYAVEYRYPDAPAEVSDKEAWAALDTSRQIYTFVLTQLGWD